MYIHISCICSNNTVNYLNIGQQLLGLTPRGDILKLSHGDIETNH